MEGIIQDSEDRSHTSTSSGKGIQLTGEKTGINRNKKNIRLILGTPKPPSHPFLYDLRYEF